MFRYGLFSIKMPYKTGVLQGFLTLFHLINQRLIVMTDGIGLVVSDCAVISETINEKKITIEHFNQI